MIKAIRERQRQRQKAIELVREYAKRLQKTIGPVTVIVYGSFARGDFNLGSDIDVMIIGDSLPARPLARLDLLYSCLDHGQIEPKGYTKSEFRKMLEHNHPWVTDALAQGVVVADHGFLGQLGYTGITIKSRE